MVVGIWVRLGGLIPSRTRGIGPKRRWISGIQIGTTTAPRSVSPNQTAVTSRSAGVPAEAAFKGSFLHGMFFGMAPTKIANTLENNQLAEIRALIAAGAAGSVSAFVKHAVGVALFDAAGWRGMLEDACSKRAVR
jgi:hypothetical protein